MWFILLMFILLFAIAYFQATQGLFSALVMLILTICCAAASFGSFEEIASMDYCITYIGPDLAHPVALGLIFGVPLLVLRLVFDKVIRRSCLLPAMVDRVGAGLCGFLTSLIMVGMIATCLQMIPLGESIIGYQRFVPAIKNSEQPPPKPNEAERNLWLQPDHFAAGTASHLSNGIFSHQQEFSQVYPNFIQQAGWVNTLNHEVSRYAEPRSIKVVSSEPLEYVYNLTPGRPRDDTENVYEPISAEGSNQFQMVRVELKHDAKDARKNHHFTLRQFRLVGRDGPEGRWEQHHPVAIQQADEAQPINRHIRYKKFRRKDWPVYDEIFAPRKDNKNQVEIVFDVSKRFVPEFLEYKRSARTSVKFSKKSSAQQSNARQNLPNQPSPTQQTNPTAQANAPTTTTAAPATQSSNSSRRSSRRSRRSRSQDSDSNSRRGGAVRGLTTQTGQSFFGDQLPFEMKSYQATKNPEISKRKLASGHIIGEIDQQPGGQSPPITTFDVPRDKRLLHLNTGKLQTRSSLGRALGQAVAVAQNYFVEDSNGARYRFIGKYAIASVNGKDIIEIQYFPEQIGTVGGLGAFSKINERQLKTGDKIVLLFLVNPGAEIDSFSTGGSATRRDDLRAETLVAPE